MTSESLLVVFLFSYVSLSNANDCPKFLRTREAVLSVASRSVDSNDWYTALNVTIKPNASSVTNLYRFIPAVAWINVSCNENTTTMSLVSQFSSSTHDSKSTTDILNHLHEFASDIPDWSLWSDRSVLVVNIHRMELSASKYVCPRLTICSIFGFLSDELFNSSSESLVFCHPILNGFYGNCKDLVRPPKVYTVLFSVSSALGILVSELGRDPAVFNYGLNFVVSAGYRLPHGVFQCPPGLFACPLPSSVFVQEVPESTPWDRRICLPLALRCDGTPNCPGSNSDELNCDNTTIIDYFPVIPEEVERMNAHLGQYDGKALYWVGYEQSVLAGASARTTSFILYGFLLGFIVFCAILVLIGYFVYKRSRAKRYSSVAEVIDPTGQGKETTIHGELLDEAVLVQNTNGAVMLSRDSCKLEHTDYSSNLSLNTSASLCHDGLNVERV